MDAKAGFGYAAGGATRPWTTSTGMSSRGSPAPPRRTELPQPTHWPDNFRSVAARHRTDPNKVGGRTLSQ